MWNDTCALGSHSGLDGLASCCQDPSLVLVFLPQLSTCQPLEESIMAPQCLSSTLILKPKFSHLNLKKVLDKQLPTAQVFLYLGSQARSQYASPGQAGVRVEGASPALSAHGSALGQLTVHPPETQGCELS